MALQRSFALALCTLLSACAPEEPAPQVLGSSTGEAQVSAAVRVRSSRVLRAPEPWRDGKGSLRDIIGWFSNGFEHAEFVEGWSLASRQREECSGLSGWPYRGAWVRGKFADNLTLYQSGEGIGMWRVSGTLSAPGQYGHLGRYERELVLTRADLLVCETFEQLGHCVVPGRGHACVGPQREELLLEGRLHRIATVDRGVRYELALLTQDAAGRTRETALVFSLRGTPSSDLRYWRGAYEIGRPPASAAAALEYGFYRPGRIEDVVLRVREPEGGVVGYEKELRGWVLRSADEDALSVSLSGAAADGRSRHVWGYFPVEDLLLGPREDR